MHIEVDKSVMFGDRTFPAKTFLQRLQSFLATKYPSLEKYSENGGKPEQ